MFGIPPNVPVHGGMLDLGETATYNHLQAEESVDSNQHDAQVEIALFL